VIADAERAIALAGVMGGAATQVSEGTANVLLESAHFAPARIRRTARRLGLATDASYRFERGVDRTGVERAADRAARLLAELAGGTVARGRLEATGSPPPGVELVELELARLNRLLGTSLGEPEVRAALARVDVAAEPGPSGRLRCRVPGHRNDLALPQDLIEEVARVRGYDEIAPSVPAARLDPGHRPDAWDAVEAARDALVHEGLVEVVTFPFLDPADLDRLGLPAGDPRRATVGVRNPLHGAESRLRPTILPTLLRVLRDNRNRQLERVGLFEASRIFVAAGGGGSELPRESLRVTAVMTRGEKPGMWEPAPPIPLFFEAKGAAGRMLRALGREVELAPGAGEPWLHPGACCSIRAGGRAEPLGVVGELHPAVAEAFGIDLPCAVVDVDLGALAALPRAIPRYREVSPYPSARRDLAVVLDAGRLAAEVLEAIRRDAGPHLQSAEIFDRYAGPGVPDGRVSLAFRLVFQRADGTLTDAEVQAALERVMEMLRHRFGGELRQGARGEGSAE
jgi:phenylalanyl-tRNA synthetase beta chain